MNSFGRWYAKNGAKLAKKRRLRYHSDSTYRQAALDRSKKQREERQAPTDGKTLTFGDAAELLEVSTVTLRSWKVKDYYPEPTRHGRHIAFSHDQVRMLKRLRDLFASYAWNMKSDQAKKDLSETVGLIYANWE